MNEKLPGLGLLIIRVGLGIAMSIHGFPKMFNPGSWEFIGGGMGVIGINFFPVFWGFMAAVAEFFGGLLLVLGAGTRIVSILLTFTMLIAMLFHISKGDDFSKYSHSMELAFVFLGLIFLGGGRYSLDQMLAQSSLVKK
jgi:putative oxidoreductase